MATVIDNASDTNDALFGIVNPNAAGSGAVASGSLVSSFPTEGSSVAFRTMIGAQVCSTADARAQQKNWEFGQPSALDFGISGTTATALASNDTTSPRAARSR